MQGRSPLSYSYVPTDGTVGIHETNIIVPFGNFSLGVQRGSLFLAGSYTYSSISFVDEYPSISTSGLENFHRIMLITGYRKSLNDEWKMMALAVPHIASNLRSKLGGKDLRGVSMVAFVRTNEASTSFLTLGLAYSTNIPVPFPIPIVSYRRIINDHWEYSIGIPKFELNYSVTSPSTIQSFFKAKGLRGNISTPVLENEQDIETQLVNRTLVGGLGYTHKLRERIAVSFEGGYSLVNMLSIQNYNRDELYDFGIDNKLYLNIGLKMGL